MSVEKARPPFLARQQDSLRLLSRESCGITGFHCAIFQTMGELWMHVDLQFHKCQLQTNIENSSPSEYIQLPYSVCKRQQDAISEDVC